MKSQTKFILGLSISLLGGGVVPLATAAAPSPSAETPSQPAAAPSSDTNPQPKFENMRNRDRNAILTEIGKRDFATIMQNWLDAGRVEHDPMKQGDIQSTLVSAMRQRTPPPEFFGQIKAFISDNSNSKLERGMMMGVLALSATKESADLLIDEATNQTDGELKVEAIHAIGGLGGRSEDENLAPALNQLWIKSNDQELIANSALSMAEIGTPSSIDLLLLAALAPDGKDNVRKSIAQSALTTVISKNAMPPLAALLTDNPPTSLQAVLAFTTLTQIVDTEDTAARTLVAWLENADSSAVPLIQSWFSGPNAQTTQSKAVTTALDPSVPFRSEANREALRAGLAKYKSGIIDFKGQMPLQQ